MVGSRCFDLMTQIYVVDDDSAETTSVQLSRDLVAGQPASWISKPLGSLRTGDRVITSHCDTTGRWVYEAASILRIQGFRCDRGVCRMTKKRGYGLTSDHRVRVQIGLAGQNVVWSNNWLYAHEMFGTETKV